MEKDKKLVILTILIVVALIIWMPKGRRKQQVSPELLPTSLSRAVPKIVPGQRKRTKFADWGRNPFVWPRAEIVGTVSDLSLSGIVWDEQASYAIIKGAIVHVGDEIAGKTVKRIEPNKVILSDGQNEYVLELE